MRAYGLVFLATGLVFLVAAVPLNSLLGLPNGGHGLWLGLAGSLMAVLAYLSFLIASDPFLDAPWDLILLSKAVSSLLFVVFAVLDRDPRFLLGAVVDSAIFIHLAMLRAGVHVPYRSRAAARVGSFHEGWFVMAQDRDSGRGFWARYGLSRLPGRERAECRAVIFDKSVGAPLVARWERPAGEAVSGDAVAYRLGESFLVDGRSVGRDADASWDLTWNASSAGALRLVSPVLSGTGLLCAGYEAVEGLIRLSGAVRVGDRSVRFQDAAAGVGHLWGVRGARGWRWARAVFERPGSSSTVFEILTATAPLAAGLEIPMTAAYLVHDGLRYPAVGLIAALTARSVLDGKTWGFRVSCGELSVEGECRLDEAMAVGFPYDGPSGAKGTCRTSMTGAMKLRIRGEGTSADLSTEDRAIVEFAEPAR